MDRVDPSLQGGEEAARLAALQEQQRREEQDRLRAAQSSTSPDGTQPVNPDPGVQDTDLRAMIQALTQQMAQSDARFGQLAQSTEAALLGLNAKVEQAGGVAQAAGRWAQEAGGAVNSMASWAQAAQAAGQPPHPAAPAQPANVKPPAPPKFKGALKEPRILEWTHQAGQFLMSAGLTETVQGVFHITNYLTEDAAVWWRLYCQRVERKEAQPVLNWWALRLLMLEQFSEINRLTTIRDQFANVRQTASVASYITKFQSIIIELPEKSEDDQVHQFLRVLKKEIQIHTRTHQPRTLSQAMRIADEADRAIYTSNSGAKASTGFKGANPKSNGTAPMQLGAVSLSPEDKARCQRDGLCFICQKPGHAARECRSGKGKRRGKKGKGKRPSQGN